jgi:predicted O-methyltransferase YrrM
MNDVEEFAYCPMLRELKQTRRSVGRSGKTFESLVALSSDNNLRTLRRLMCELKPKRTLEVGLSFGGSGLVFTSSHRDNGNPPSRQHIAIDPFQDSVWDDCGLVAIEKSDLAGYLDFRKAFSSIELPKLVSEESRFDLIYIDGSHLFEDVFIDAYYSMRLLADGGVVTFDDSSNQHVRKVIRFLRTNCASGLQEIDLGLYRRDDGASLRYRTAKMLGRVQLTGFRRTGKVDRNWDSPYIRF